MNSVCVAGGGGGVVRACDGCVSLPVCSFSGVLFFSHAVNHTHRLTRTRCHAFSVHAVGEKRAQEEREEGDERVAGVNLIPLGPKDMPKTHSGGLESLLSQILYSPMF